MFELPHFFTANDCDRKISLNGKLRQSHIKKTWLSLLAHRSCGGKLKFVEMAENRANQQQIKQHRQIVRLRMELGFLEEDTRRMITLIDGGIDGNMVGDRRVPLDELMPILRNLNLVTDRIDNLSK